MIMNGILKKIAVIILAVMMTFSLWVSEFTHVYAKENTESVSAEIYEFEEDSNYEFSSSSPVSSGGAVGKLSISGEKYSVEKADGIVDFAVNRDYMEQNENSNLSFSYTYGNELFTAANDSWHLVNDGGKKIENIELDSKIEKGAIIVQTSKDGKIWLTTYTDTNIFGKSSNGIEDFYQTTDVQLAAGCYYRVIVAYKLSRKVDTSKILFWNKDKYESKKMVEVYNFHAYDVKAKNTVINSNAQKYNLGSRVRTEKFDGYYGTTEMKKGDPHYGWDLGRFFVSGYTDTSFDQNDNVIFLKNTGDQVSLWFNLQQNIKCLNNNSSLTIEADTAGYDQYFETPTMNFGCGALIIRKINNDNTVEKPQIYTDYLLGNATVGADTKVSLFEEGDYEVALDYAIKHDKTLVFGASILPGESHYRIYFKFSVRNSNSMFFPRDLKTSSELSNNAIAPNGFYLDLAGSQYLNLSYTREILSPGANSLSEDIRENKAAKDGDSFTKEGIYTITVSNPSTGKNTIKRIYVGNDEIIKAYMTTGVPIEEIKDRISNGYTIADDGNIVDSSTNLSNEAVNIVENETDSSENASQQEKTKFENGGTNTEDENKNSDEVSNSTTIDKNNQQTAFPTMPIAIGTVVVVILAFFGISKHKSNNKKEGRSQ